MINPSNSRGEVYNRFQMYPLTVSEKEVAVSLSQARFDPRLMEILTEYIRDFWWTLHPVELNKFCKKNKSPFMIKAVTAILLDYCKTTFENRADFSKWMIQAIRGIKDPAPQLLYVGIIPVGSKMMKEEVERALPTLFRHNLIVKDLPFNKDLPGELKSESNLPQNRIDEIDFLKFKWARKIKNFKYENHITNAEMTEKYNINRVFLSKILNNKLGKISVEYLHNKSSLLPEYLSQDIKNLILKRKLNFR